MAHGLSYEIRCPVCWNDLKDPVCLPCEHSYCRGCITEHLIRNATDTRCPECRSPFTQNDIRVNRVLRNLVYAAKAHLREHQALRETVSESTRTEIYSQDFTEHCIYHKEKLKLFCVTDQKLICVICREEETHQGHTFKTLDAVFPAKKKKTLEAVESLSSIENALVVLINEQAEEILKTMEKSKALSAQISVEFKKLHQFLSDKEKELKTKLEDEENVILNVMGQNMSAMEEMLNDGGEKQVVMRSALEMKQPHQFLQWWSENGRFIIREMSSITTHLILQDLSVTPDTLSLGPYETYLQFFVWKEMLKSIQLVPHHHTLVNNGDPSISISPNERSIQPKRVSKVQKSQSSSVWVKTVSSFNIGKHLWELDVGRKVDWGVGVCSCESGKIVNDTLLCFKEDSGLHIQQTHDRNKSKVDYSSRFRKISVYLDCEKNQVSFYNADRMTLIDSRTLSKSPPYCLCLSPGLYLDGKNSDPLTVCWY